MATGSGAVQASTSTERHTPSPTGSLHHVACTWPGASDGHRSNVSMATSTKPKRFPLALVSSNCPGHRTPSRESTHVAKSSSWANCHVRVKVSRGHHSRDDRRWATPGKNVHSTWDPLAQPAASDHSVEGGSHCTTGVTGTLSTAKRQREVSKVCTGADKTTVPDSPGSNDPMGLSTKDRESKATTRGRGTSRVSVQPTASPHAAL